MKLKKERKTIITKNIRVGRPACAKRSSHQIEAMEVPDGAGDLTNTLLLKTGERLSL